MQCPEDEDRYVHNFSVREGVELDKDAIRPNAAKRGLAKLCLNSISGKLTERNNRTISKMISDPHELYRFLETLDVEVMNRLFASNDVVSASWRFIVEKIPSLRHTNKVVDYMRLYSYLEILQEHAIYCDTDSVLCIQQENEPRLMECGVNFGKYGR